MKKILSVLIIAVLSIVLCSCDPGTYYIQDEELSDIVSIQLIQYDNSNQKTFTSWVPNHFDDLKPFDVCKYVVIKELENERIADFVLSFKETDILRTYYAYDSPKDLCIKCNYSNGNFLIIWANYAKDTYAGYIGEYSANGTVLSFWGCFSSIHYYEDLVSEYFNHSLE